MRGDSWWDRNIAWAIPVCVCLPVLLGVIALVYFVNRADDRARSERNAAVIWYIEHHGYDGARLDGFWRVDSDVIPLRGCVGRPLMFSAGGVPYGGLKEVDIEGCCNDDGVNCRLITEPR